MSLVEQFRRARRAGVPLTGVETPDPTATIEEITEAVNGNTPVVAWDCIRGIWGVNELGMAYANSEVIGNPTAMLMDAAPELPEGIVMFVLGMDEWLNESTVRQGIWNLRNPYKATQRMVVLLGATLTLPASLANDVVILEEEYPDDEALGSMVGMLDEQASEVVKGRARMEDRTKAQVVDAVRGLPLGAAENIVAMNILKDGVDAEGVWEAKRRQVEQQKGISIWQGNESFDDIQGLANLKQFGKMVIDGRKPPKGIVFIDEIEKMIAGSSTAGGDSSGVSQGFLQQLLTYMQDFKVRGIILIGPPGTGKSLIAKAMGNQAGVPTIAFDLNGMKGSLVGESETAMRSNLKVVTSVTGGESFWIATCNSISSLPPELRRRFRCGTFFVDLPTKEERESIWQHYLRKYDLDPNQDIPNDTNWTGAEIENCCDNSYEFDCSLTEAAQYVIPVYTQDRERIEKLRKDCDGRYLSASELGLFRIEKDTRTRKMELN